MFSIRQNPVLEKLKNGKTALGLQLRSRSPLIAELAGCLGFDFLYIETEHFACSDETVEQLVRAAQLSRITPWVRVTDASAENISHMLDIGARGVIVPHLETAGQARALVDAVKFPPLGHRGSSFTSRAACFGCVDADEYIQAANEACCAIGMIETVRAVENLEEILDTGIDMIRVGRADLSLEMGLRKNQTDPRFVDTLRYITAEAEKRGIPVGTGVQDVSQALYYQELGFRCLTTGSDLDSLKRTLGTLLHSIRGALDGEVRSPR